MGGRGRARGGTSTSSHDFSGFDEEYAEPERDAYPEQTAGSKMRNYQNEQKKKNEDTVVKLHVTNIPTSLTESGLANIFSSEGGTPCSIYINRKPTNSVVTNNLWGFVGFRTAGEAQTAISALNRKPPYNLSVNFARTDEDREHRRDKIPQTSPSSSEVGFTVKGLTPARGRGQLPPMCGKPPSSLIATRILDEPFRGDNMYQDYDQGRFSHHDAPYEQNMSNNVFGPLNDLQSNDGRRKISMGRGAFMPTGTPIKENRYRCDEIMDNMDEKIAAYLSKKVKDMSSEENIKYTSDMKLNLPFKLGKCEYCGRSSLYACSKCKTWYCCNSCMQSDWSTHRENCKPRTMVFKEDGNISVKEEVDVLEKLSTNNMPKLSDVRPQTSFDNCTRSPRNGDSYNQHMSNNQRPKSSGNGSDRGNVSNQENLGNQNGYDQRGNQRNSLDHRGNQISHDQRGNQNSHEQRGNQNSHEQRGNQRTNEDQRGKQNSYDQRGNQNGQDQYRSQNNQDNRRPQNNQDNRRPQNNQDHRGNSHSQDVWRNQNSQDNVNKGQQGNEYKNRGFDDRHNKTPNELRNDKVESPSKKKERQGHNRYNRNVDTGVFVKPSPAAPPLSHLSPVPTNKEVLNKSGETKVFDSPIPRGAFTEVSVIVGESKEEFWAYKTDDMSSQLDLLTLLAEHCESAKSVPNNLVKVGFKCAAPFQDAWYRAEILEVTDNTVNVIFMDFGNESEVPMTDIKILTPDFLDLPALAHKYVFAPCLGNPDLKDEDVIKIKPVSKELMGRVVVHAEGVKYPPDGSEEVTILVTVKRNVYWVLRVCDTLKVIMMTKSLGELENVSIEPVLGETYVHFFNNVWCRGKVISESPLKIFYIDYGNTSEVEVDKNELHPVPLTYATNPPLAIKITLAEGTPEQYCYLKVMSQMLIKPINKLDDGSYVCEVEDDRWSRQYDESNVKHLLYVLRTNQKANLHIETMKNEEFLTGSIIPSNTSKPHHLEISKILGEEVQDGSKFKPETGLMVAAKWDNVWHRGYLMMIRGNDYIVALIDRGRVVIPEKVAPLPKIINDLPECGVRAILKGLHAYQDFEGKDVELTDIHREGDTVHAHVEGLGKAVLVPWEPAIEEAGLSSLNIASGSKVTISAYHFPSAIYIQSCKPEDLLVRSEVIQDLALCTIDGSALKRKPLCGEFLACRYAEDGCYYRAQIFRKQENRYKVNFVDYGNTETVNISDFKPLPDSLKKVPCCAVKVGLKGVEDIPFNPVSMHYLNELCANMMEFFISYDKDLSEVVLELTGGESVNNTLAEFQNPSWNKPGFTPLKGQVFMQRSLRHEVWEKNERFDICIANVLKFDNITVLRTSSALLNHIECNLTPKITKYCESFPDESYNPRSDELCLAKFHEDEKWYRALCLKGYQQNASELYFVDYGNYGVVLHRCIRKMIQEFMDSPAALKSCKVFGLPETVKDDIGKYLKKFYAGLKTEAICIEDKGHDNTLIWIPSLEKQAFKWGLSIKTPPSLST